MKTILYILALFLTTSLIITCAPRDAVSQKPATLQTSPEPQTAAGEPWKQEWSATLNTAKKEGKVIIFTSVPPIIRKELSNGFKKSYENIEVEFVSASTGAQLTQKIFSERRAGIFSADLYLSGATTIVADLKPAGVLAPLEPALILPQVKDPKAWYQGKLPFYDKEKTIFSFIASHGGEDTLAVNSDVVKPEEIKSYRDLLATRFKEKIVMMDPTIAGKGGRQVITLATQSALGWDYYRELVKQKPVLVRDYRLQMDWIAQRKYLVGFSPDEGTALEFRNAGVPVEVFGGLKENILWIAGSFGYINLMDRAPHLNAAKVFANWLLDKEGQYIFGKNNLTQSSRIDVDTSYMIEAGKKLRRTDVKYFFADDENILLKDSEFKKMIIEIFEPVLR